MRCGHLFNGIGGFALAAHWMGWQNIWHSETDEYCNKIMARHFPESKQYGDIKQIDFTKIPAIELITGGFPCQPYSQAGKRRGKQDERHLWPEMLAAIRTLKPRWVVGENVYGIVNWSDGLVFEQVQADLEDEGYSVQAYILPAVSVNAPHRRDRTWFVAYSKKERVQRHRANGQQEPQSYAAQKIPLRDSPAESWENWPTEPAILGMDDGVSNRVERITALGNAIFPQVALQIFRAISQFENQHSSDARFF